MAVFGLGALGMVAVAEVEFDDAAIEASDPVDEWTVAPPPTRASTTSLPPAPDEPEDPADALDTAIDPAVWDRVADCESGDWDADAVPRPGSARWDYGLEFDHGDIFQGGLNFHPDTWETYRDPDMPDHAGDATRVEEIEIAERVLADQGWEAWPVCSEMMDVPDPDDDATEDTTQGDEASGA